MRGKAEAYIHQECNILKDITYIQGWAQGSFVKAEAESSRPRRGRLNSRQGRGETTTEKNPPSPRCIAVPNLVALSQTVWQRVNGLVAPPSWVEVIYDIISLYGVSRGSMGKGKGPYSIRCRTASCHQAV